MITISLDDSGNAPLYERVYRHIRTMIIEGGLSESEKLPSKRRLAEHLGCSVNTVENAYAQLIAEGYIQAVEKKGYFVRRVDQPLPQSAAAQSLESVPDAIENDYQFDMTTNAVDTAGFPFSIWAKLMRESLKEEHASLLAPIHPQGDPQLRAQIAAYLREFRNMEVAPGQIVLGAGTEYLLGLIAELLEARWLAVEEPGYRKLLRVLSGRRIGYLPIGMDSEGMRIEELGRIEAAACVTPSRHFPLGTVMSAGRRQQLLKWANEADRYIIEDDFDCEYRYSLRQIPPLYSMDSSGRVIYLNTFARTLSPSLRIGYMVLPIGLLKQYHERLMFYSCTVSQFEQSTLTRFLSGGYFERHISRMRIRYRGRRDAFLQELSTSREEFEVCGAEAGLHLLVRSKRGMPEVELVEAAKQRGIRVFGLSGYYSSAVPETHTVVMGYGGFDKDSLREIAWRLSNAWC